MRGTSNLSRPPSPTPIHATTPLKGDAEHLNNRGHFPVDHLCLQDCYNVQRVVPILKRPQGQPHLAENSGSPKPREYSGVVRGSSVSRKVRILVSPKLRKIPIAWNATGLHTPSVAYVRTIEKMNSI